VLSHDLQQQLSLKGLVCCAMMWNSSSASKDWCAELQLQQLAQRNAA